MRMKKEKRSDQQHLKYLIIVSGTSIDGRIQAAWERIQGTDEVAPSVQQPGNRLLVMLSCMLLHRRLLVDLCLPLRRFCASAPNALVHAHNQQALQQLSNCMAVHDDFISEEEEESLVTELNPILKKMRYESNHWDNVSCCTIFHVLI